MSEIKEDVKITTQKVTGHICDNCGFIEKDASIYDDTWLSFSMAHQSWGNDSCESYKNYDVCSPKCFLELGLKEGKDNLEGEDDPEIADMPWEFFKKLAEIAK